MKKGRSGLGEKWEKSENAVEKKDHAWLLSIPSGGVFSLPGEIDLDWEDYNWEWDEDDGGPWGTLCDSKVISRALLEIVKDVN